MTTRLFTLVLLVLLGAPASTLAEAKSQPLTIPDFTRGDAIPEGAKHDWNLGPTGLRGWMFCDKMVTTDARQISVTQVEKGSPADGVFLVGDVLLGVGGKPFAYDPRTEFGKALTTAESEAGGGNWHVTRWRAGKVEDVVVRLPVLGSYSATAPYDCPKSKRILEEGCKALAGKVAKSPLKTIPSCAPSMRSRCWRAAIRLPPAGQKGSGMGGGLFIGQLHADLALRLRDDVPRRVCGWRPATQSVMPGLRRLALEAAKGQSAVGSWGHGFARARRTPGGYGMMNSPGVPLTIGLVLAREAGVKDPEVARAIERSAAVAVLHRQRGDPLRRPSPVDREPRRQRQVRHGCGAVQPARRAKGRGVLLAHEPRLARPERDTGHTGNYFNMLWAMPGVAQSGPQATGAWMQEFGAWYFDLARRWDGTFVHQGRRSETNDSYEGWDAPALPAGLRDAAEEALSDRQTGQGCTAQWTPLRPHALLQRRPWLGQQGPLQHLRQIQRRAAAGTPRQLVAGGSRTGRDGDGPPQGSVRFALGECWSRPR
jgi:hypothetical protein